MLCYCEMKLRNILIKTRAVSQLHGTCCKDYCILIVSIQEINCELGFILIWMQKNWSNSFNPAYCLQFSSKPLYGSNSTLEVTVCSLGAKVDKRVTKNLQSTHCCSQSLLCYCECIITEGDFAFRFLLLWVCNWWMLLIIFWSTHCFLL